MQTYKFVIRKVLRSTYGKNNIEELAVKLLKDTHLDNQIHQFARSLSGIPPKSFNRYLDVLQKISVDQQDRLRPRFLEGFPQLQQGIADE